MKKFLLVLSLLFGGITSYQVVYAEPASQVCDTSNPCLYTGSAKSKKNHTGIPNVSVYYSKDGNHVLASFVWGGNTQVVYCFEETKGEWYFNWKGDKWYFNM